MDPSEIPAAGSPSPPKKEKELQPQSPKHSPLKVSKDSYKIKKPPLPPRPLPPPPPLSPGQLVIRTNASDFMPLVQGLTGLDTAPTLSSSGPTSSAHFSSGANVVVPPSAHFSSGAGANVVVPPAAHSGSIETSSGSNSPYSEEEESRNDI